MRIAIYGTGGVGGYFGGRLAQIGADVIFIARGAHLAAIQSHGLRVESVEGDFVVQPATAVADPAQVGPVDALFVCVKAWQVPEIAPRLEPLLGPDTYILPLQNGIESAGQLADVYGQERVLGGLCGLISYIAGPGHICHAGGLPFIKFGELDNRPSERVVHLRQLFERASGLVVETPPDIHVAIWQKFLLIATWSGVGAVTRAPIGILRSQPETRRLLEQVMQEIYDVAHASGIALPPETFAQTLAFFDGIPADGTASMQRDVLAGRPSELESQNGAVVRAGLQAGVQTPLNEFIYHALLPLERRARGELSFPI
ncbi:MAG: 2-dehydropantoate 2-reductase [Caldilineaceae bacterium]|nr:2-dehydropantoate 2-reductase [Caldilineaceae bacterium]